MSNKKEELGMKYLLDKFLKEVNNENMVINYVQVHQGDKVIADYQRLESKTRLNAWSVSKGFVSIAAGIAIEEGLITLDEKLCDSFSEYLPQSPCDNLLNLTVRHLLTMTTGLEDALFFMDDCQRYVTTDWIAYFFKQQFGKKHGEQFLYCNFNTYMLSCLIEKKAGANLLEYLRYRLFEPLEIYSPDWTLCPKGHVHAASGLYLTIDELVNYGKMLLEKGLFKGKRIVSQSYIEEATKNQLGFEYKNGYGYHFIINPDRVSFRSDGKFGQYVIVMPEKEAVIAVQSLESKNVFPVVWEHIAQKL
jgi:CubicO group peptidase (beta-lactamase class C family)